MTRIRLIIGLLATSTVGWGAVNSCGTGQTIAALEDQSAGPDGCAQVDKIFSTFTVSGVEGIAGGGNQIPPDSNLTVVGLNSDILGSGTSAIGLRIIDSSGPAVQDWQVSTGDNADGLLWASQIDFLVSINGAYTPAPVGGYVITGLTFAHPNVSIFGSYAGGGGVSLNAFFCPGLTTFTCATPIQLGFSGQTSTVSATSYDSIDFSGVTDVAVRLIFNANMGTDNNTRGFSVTDVSFYFEQEDTGVPEPATASLMAAALVGLGLLAARKRQRR